MQPDIYGILGSFGIFSRNLNIAPLFQTKRGCCAWVCTGSSTGGSVGLRIWIFCSLPAKPCRPVASTFNQIFNMLRAEVEHFVPARIFEDCHCWLMAACNWLCCAYFLHRPSAAFFFFLPVYCSVHTFKRTYFMCHLCDGPVLLTASVRESALWCFVFHRLSYLLLTLEVRSCAEAAPV